MRLWKREFLRLGLLAILGWGLGWILGIAGFGLAVGISLYLVYHLLQLRALHHWLTHTPQSEPPAASGLWGELFDRLYRHQKAQRITQSRLLGILRRIEESSEAMRDSVVMLDRHGDMEWWNSAAERMLGLKTAHDRGHHITNLIRDPRFVGYFHSLDYREPLTLHSPIDERMVLQFQITLYGDDERLVMARDITRLHQLEEMRRDFVANVSHELRTPLTVLSGYLETYSDYADQLPPRFARGLGQMQEQTTRMQNLVNDLLLLSRLETDRGGADHAAFDLQALLESVKRDAEALSAGRQTISVELEQPASLTGSEQEIRSAISNLVFNAVRYTPPGSHITLRFKPHPKGGCLEVEDDGEGIDPIHIPRLTERFYRVDKGRSTATGGTGLGLAIVKHVLLRHDAHLEINSHPGQGATFRCIFPASRLILATDDAFPHHA
ncbi:phosphate regulon sensor histidine kinase PhoR [Halomonas urumqiensis]|uniref:Phosphate regulon sensor protein PhoR n=1 Tax=Halomonas urumqiensis TaxID=1684789 RepID=A0A2N7UJM8_9GAMM|nr:phosphate regulon sensor histidine kinase PhoR [Halomonas urumqiensis]PMR80619.1 PAS domain-containing sensor histidine kinase [Halomonas urumqiensis]PTB02692.1 phosphate regulon sensor histidine kinase PhoR [Halomonas urumqiensis]GHE21189.1 phosphate regulon sensor protein PhoR [Halomonas urumqiensis]